MGDKELDLFNRHKEAEIATFEKDIEIQDSVLKKNEAQIEALTKTNWPMIFVGFGTMLSGLSQLLTTIL